MEKIFTICLLFISVTTLKAQIPVITNITPAAAKPGYGTTITGKGFNTTTANTILQL